MWTPQSPRHARLYSGPNDARRLRSAREKPSAAATEEARRPLRNRCPTHHVERSISLWNLAQVSPRVHIINLPHRAWRVKSGREVLQCSVMIVVVRVVGHQRAVNRGSIGRDQARARARGAENAQRAEAGYQSGPASSANARMLMAVWSSLPLRGCPNHMHPRCPSAGPAQMETKACGQHHALNVHAKKQASHVLVAELPHPVGP